MLDRCLRPFLVVHQDDVRFESADGPVEQDERYLRRDEVAEVRGLRRDRGDNDQAVHAASSEGLHEALLAVEILVRVGEQDCVALRLECVGERAGGGRKKGVLDVAHDQTDRVGDVRCQRARHGMAAIPHAACRILDQPTRGWAHVPVAAESACRSRLRDASRPCNVFDGHPHCASMLALDSSIW